MVATLLKQALEEEGVRVFIENEFTQAAAAMPVGWVSAPRIMVAKEDATRARDIVATLVDSVKRRSGDNDDATCLTCGAPMPEGMETCAACGWSYETDERTND